MADGSSAHDDRAKSSLTARAPAVEIRAASKEFGAGAGLFRALDDVSLSIRANEFFTLLGPSGCGKTTLLRMIAGFEAPTRGMILLDGEDITDRPPFHRPVNTVFQNYALFPHMSVAENIGFGLTMLGRRKSEVAATVAEMLRLVRMEDLAGRRTSQISGGQQQRVALARALAPRPKVLLLDEPLSALDLKLRKEMQIELKRLQHETGITFIFVTHDQEEALTMSDRIAVMSKGRVLQVGGPRDIYHAPVDRFVAGFIGETNMLPATIERIDGATARARLAIGPALTASVSDDIDGDGDVVVMLRPEHARLVEAGAADAALTGTLAEIVYFGTDTHFHIRLADGSTFIVREQNRAGVDEVHAAGAAVGIAVDAGAARILRP